MITQLCATLNDLTGRSKRDRLVAGVVAGIDRDPKAKVTITLFTADGVPSVVAKVAREESAERALRAEYAALRAIVEAASPQLATQVPTPLMLSPVAGRLVLAATALPGSAMTVRYYSPGHVRDPRRVRRDLELAGEWLVQLRAETAASTLDLGASTFIQAISPVMDRYRTIVGWAAWEERLFTELVREADDLLGVNLPLSAVHGDFALGNILLDGDRIAGVVDWERARMLDIPFYDVFKLVASYSSYLDRAIPPRGGSIPGHPGWARAHDRWPASKVWTNLAGFMYGFFGEGWFPDIVRGFVSDQSARLGVPFETAALFLPVFVAEQATALDNDAYREGYRNLLHAVAQVRQRGWLHVVPEVVR